MQHSGPVPREAPAGWGHEPPPQIAAIGMLQVASGVINLTLGAFCFGPAITGGAGCLYTWPAACLTGVPPGVVCGVLGLLLAPVGVVEIVAGSLALSDPTRCRDWVRAAAMFEVASVIAGGFTSVLAGALCMMLLQDPVVHYWLDWRDYPE